jgi:Cdc6-like AAA superfamily ATPase
MNDGNVEALALKVEEAARSTAEGVRYFIEPAPGTLKRAIAKRHHVIFGRRGSGKSSLLRKAGADLTLDRRPIAYVNLESFKSHSYPDVLLSVLIATFREFAEWMRTAAINPANKKTFWEKLFGTKPSRPAFNRKECQELAIRLDLQINQLEQQLHSADNADMKVIREKQGEASRNAELESKIGSTQVTLSAGIKSGVTEKLGESVHESYKRQKQEFLHRHIMEYQQIFRDIAKASGGDSYLFLDDLYHIVRSDQPSLIDYFHRIAKDNGLWLKVGTIRHRSYWYRLGNPPLGVKLGDDVDEIDLDVTLEKYATAKRFLMSILKQFAVECSITLGELLTDGAQDRLVLACGGVARDCLAIFRKSIENSREQNAEKVNAEHVNEAAGDYEISKREDFKRDSSSDEKELEAEFDGIVRFCLTENNINCLLIDKNLKGRKADLIHQLVDLKLLHLARSRVTVRTRPGDIFEAYMLDFSQYSGSRKRRGLDVIEFWKDDDALRKASLIYS